MREYLYDIDWDEVKRINDEFGNSISEKKISLSLNRAMRRTEASLRRLTLKELPNILGLRAASALRKRIKTIKGSVRENSSVIAMWFGLNDLPVSSFKGRPKKTADGAEFNGMSYSGAFLGRSQFKNKRTIFKRVGKDRLPVSEQLYPISEEAILFIDDDLFDRVLDIFWNHFERDLKARIKYDIGWKK